MLFNKKNKQFFKIISEKFRKNRANIFFDSFEIDNTTKILDLGGGNGEYITSFLGKKYWDNVTVCDVRKKTLGSAKSKGLNIILIDDKIDRLPFKDNYFDIVFCNSVIEHVTIPKDEIWNCRNNNDFYLRAIEKQKFFAEEIIRIGKNYYVQTPNKNFPFETHAWIPLIQFLPRSMQISFIKFFNKFWIKKTQPDWNLLSEQLLKYFFPNSLVLKEKFLGLTKSFIIIKKDSIS